MFCLPTDTAPLVSYKLSTRSNTPLSLSRRKCFKIISFLHTTLTLSPGLNPATSNDMDVKFIDVRWWFFWHVTCVFERFVRSGVHVTERLGTLLKQNRRYFQLGNRDGPKTANHYSLKIYSPCTIWLLGPWELSVWPSTPWSQTRRLDTVAWSLLTQSTENTWTKRWTQHVCHHYERIKKQLIQAQSGPEN